MLNGNSYDFFKQDPYKFTTGKNYEVYEEWKEKNNVFWAAENEEALKIQLNSAVKWKKETILHDSIRYGLLVFFFAPLLWFTVKSTYKAVRWLNNTASFERSN
jgi:hypothetical protein